MANSKRQVLLDYLASTLFPSITTANGYNFNVSKSERGLRSYDNMTDEEFPALFVASADEERENIGSVTTFISKMTVRVYGAVKSSSDHVQAELDKLIEDVTKALYADALQGGKTIFTDIRRIETDEGDLAPHAFFRMQVEFQHVSDGTSP